MKLSIWNQETKTVKYGIPKPAYEIEIDDGTVIEVKDGDKVLFSIEVG